ncbi:MAG: helix-turn-helix domain-containing protein [Nitrospiria bacterium]
MRNIFNKKTIRRTITVEGYTEFAEILVTARKKADITQVVLSQQSGVPRVSIAMYETGKCLPPLPMFVKLCVALKTTPNALLKF